MSNSDLLSFARGQVSFAGGNLQQTQDVESTFTNAGKLVSTLAKNPAGFTTGNKAVEISGNAIMSEDGAERAWEDKVDSPVAETAKFKVPGGAVSTYLVILTEFKLQLTLEEGTKYSYKMIGLKVKT